MRTTNSHNDDAARKIRNIQNQEAVRLVVLVAAVMGILETQGALSRVLHSQPTASTVTTVAAFAMMPLFRKVWPLEGEKPFTAKTWVVWVVFLGTLALGSIVVHAPPPFLSAWFGAHPTFAALESAGGGWLLPGAVLLICGLVYLFRAKGPS
jgi:hypothetical protein